MSGGHDRFPRSWLGFQTRETKRYLRKLIAQHNYEAKALEEQIRLQQTRNEQLQSRIADMNRELKANAFSADFEILMQERLDRSVEAIVRQGEAEIEHLRSLQKRKLDSHHHQMAAWDKQYDDYRSAIDKLLGEMYGWVDKVKDQRFSEMSENTAQEADEAIRFAADWQSNSADSDELGKMEAQQEEEMADALRSSAKVLQFRLRSIIKETAVAKEAFSSLNDTMTADGLTVEKPSEYWGDLQPYLTNSVSQAPAVFHATSEPVDAVPSAAPRKDEANVSAKTASMASQGLSEEILSIQNRYIVGKAAGENLYAADGSLIISKDQIITGAVVQLAERDGKLPELILHMVIPGFGDDK